MYRCENKSRQRLAKNMTNNMTIGKIISIRVSFGSLKLKFANYSCELKHSDYLKIDKIKKISFIRSEIKKMKNYSILKFSDSICKNAFQNLLKE